MHRDYKGNQLYGIIVIKIYSHMCDVVIRAFRRQNLTDLIITIILKT